MSAMSIMIHSYWTHKQKIQVYNKYYVRQIPVDIGIQDWATQEVLWNLDDEKILCFPGNLRMLSQKKFDLDFW